MKDLIDRQETIEALGERPRFSTGGGYEMGVKEQYDRDLLAIINMPSAQPERQKGEWIDYTEDGYVECPFCHNATNCDGNKDELHFCFSCGADMREVDDERPD